MGRQVRRSPHSLEEGLLITELATRSEGHCLGLLLGGENMYRTEEDAGYGQIPIYTHPPTIVWTNTIVR